MRTVVAFRPQAIRLDPRGRHVIEYLGASGSLVRLWHRHPGHKGQRIHHLAAKGNSMQAATALLDPLSSPTTWLSGNPWTGSRPAKARRFALPPIRFPVQIFSGFSLTAASRWPQHCRRSDSDGTAKMSLRCRLGGGHVLLERRWPRPVQPPSKEAAEMPLSVLPRGRRDGRLCDWWLLPCRPTPGARTGGQ